MCATCDWATRGCVQVILGSSGATWTYSAYIQSLHFSSHSITLWESVTSSVGVTDHSCGCVSWVSLITHVGVSLGCGWSLIWVCLLSVADPSCGCVSLCRCVWSKLWYTSSRDDSLSKSCYWSWYLLLFIWQWNNTNVSQCILQCSLLERKLLNLKCFIIRHNKLLVSLTFSPTTQCEVTGS